MPTEAAESGGGVVVVRGNSSVSGSSSSAPGASWMHLTRCSIQAELRAVWPSGSQYGLPELNPRLAPPPSRRVSRLPHLVDRGSVDLL